MKSSPFACGALAFVTACGGRQGRVAASTTKAPASTATADPADVGTWSPIPNGPTQPPLP